MKGNKIKYLIIAIISCIALTNCNVNASVDVKAGFSGSSASNLRSNVFKDFHYRNYSFYIEYENNGKTERNNEVYCVDPGYHLNSSGTSYSCDLIRPTTKADRSMIYLVNKLSGHNPVTANLAVRMLATMSNSPHRKDTMNTPVAKAIYCYTKMRYNTHETKMDTSCPRFGELKSRKDGYREYLDAGLVDYAYKLALDAYVNHSNYWPSNYPTSVSSTKANSSLKFSLASNNENNVTINVTSNNAIKLEDSDFTCTNCIINKVTADSSNKKWTVDLTVTAPSCNYTLKVKYEKQASELKKAVYLCKSTHEDDQNLVMNVKTDSISTSSSSSTKATATYKGVIPNTTGGNYYKQYCSNAQHFCEIVDGKYYGINGNEVTPEVFEQECGEKEVDQCNQVTEIKIPSYCDDSNNKKIEITAPDDIKYCIFNEKDEADNTYKMLDGQIKEDNPYCAVYCKEDYTINLPGARFTTSGRYFALSDVEVNAKRSCYTTNPSGSSNKTNIEIDKFVSDVKNAQISVVNAFNAYSEAVARDELAKNATEHKTYGCDDEESTWYETSSGSYIAYDINCNDATGVCVASKKVETIASFSWGTAYSCEKHSCSKGEECKDGVKHSTESDDKGPDYESKVESTRAPLNSAKNNLKLIVDNFEACYDWHNQLCMDPDVTFDYQEQYNTSINYKQKGSPTINKDVEISYNTNLDIDRKYPTTNNPDLKDYDYVTCSEDNCDGKETANKISTLAERIYHLKKVSTGKALYNNNQAFESRYPTGVVSKVPSGSNEYQYLGAIFPVAYNTPTGVYNWILEFDKIGMYNDTHTTQCSDNSLGRLNDVAEVISEKDQEISANLEYVCVYVVDCPECVYECSCGNNKDCVEKYENGEKVCKITTTDEQCPDCEIYCVNCIFDGDGATYMFRPISLTNINPNNRSLGANWTDEKGNTVKSQIESTGEEVYKEAQYSYLLTPIQMKNLRDHNKSNTYANDSLNYHWVNGNVYGTSSLLDDKSKKYFTELARSTDWKTWSNYLWDSNGNSYSGPSLN